MRTLSYYLVAHKKSGTLREFAARVLPLDTT